MRDDFAVFILSHGRANECHTVNSLLKAGYSGKYFIIVDDLDDQREEYIKNFGETVVVFDKKAWAEITDTITNPGDLRSPVFARNACYEIAKERGIQFFGEFDDDINAFMYRYADEGHLRGTPVANIDSLFDAMVEYMIGGGSLLSVSHVGLE